MLSKIIIGMLGLLSPLYMVAQQPNKDYPKTTGYMSIVHPIVTAYTNETVYNFTNDYTVGFPVGINILKSDKLGFSFEITPFIKANATTSLMSNLLFHPGVILRFPKGVSVNNRLAFETSGRFGYTLVLSKVVAKTAQHNFFVAMPFPLRWGNNKAFSAGVGLQAGITF